MKRNTQPVSKPFAHIDGNVQIHSIFHTIQGEGPFVGRQAIFIRLEGCNLQCPGCDTEYTGGQLYPPETVLQEVDRLTTHYEHDIAYRVCDLIVITGGEPFRQDIYNLVATLISAGYIVQIETNGTLPLTDKMVELKTFFKGENFFIICSPKGRLHKGIRPYIDAFKYVLHHKDVCPDTSLPTYALTHRLRVEHPPKDFEGNVYLQPMDCQDDEINRKNLDAVLRGCKIFNYILCVQVHKIVNVE